MVVPEGAVIEPGRSEFNAFVERFRGTCLHLHYRTAFRYRFYETADDVDSDLQAWLRFSDYQRPHRGYRTRVQDDHPPPSTTPTDPTDSQR